MEPHSTSRRDFLQTSAVGVAAMGMIAAAPPAAEKNAGDIPMRRFGRTDEQVSVIALGGHACTNPKKLDDKESHRLIQRAVDEGITFMDNCWDYHDGVAEERIGTGIK